MRNCKWQLALAMFLLAGCAEQPEYRGYAPSVRTMSDRGDMRDYYVGLNFKFAVDKPTAYHTTSVSPAVTASAAPAGLTPSAAVVDDDNDDE